MPSNGEDREDRGEGEPGDREEMTKGNGWGEKENELGPSALLHLIIHCSINRPPQPWNIGRLMGENGTPLCSKATTLLWYFSAAFHFTSEPTAEFQLWTKVRRGLVTFKYI